MKGLRNQRNKTRSSVLGKPFSHRIRRRLEKLEQGYGIQIESLAPALSSAAKKMDITPPEERLAQMGRLASH